MPGGWGFWEEMLWERCQERSASTNPCGIPEAVIRLRHTCQLKLARISQVREPLLVPGPVDIFRITLLDGARSGRPCGTPMPKFACGTRAS